MEEIDLEENFQNKDKNQLEAIRKISEWFEKESYVCFALEKVDANQNYQLATDLKNFSETISNRKS
jgi:hypothetical protein